MARYKIYDNTSDVITPVGEKLTAEQWLDRYQWGRYTKMIVGGGIGRYPKDAKHPKRMTGWVHIDTRTNKSRWKG